MSEHSFCQIHLKVTMEAVRAIVPKEIQKEAWAYKYSRTRDDVEFQVPSKDFYWFGGACCLWEAKAQGWAEYMNQHHKEAYDKFGEENWNV